MRCAERVSRVHIEGDLTTPAPSSWWGLGNDYLSLGEWQARLDATMTVELLVYRVCQNFF